jgi:hypothetical protein
MIFPHLRNSFGRAEAGLLLTLVAPDPAAREREEDRLREEGFDTLLDDPRTLNALLAGTGLSLVPPPLVFYLLVRHVLLEDGINNPVVADYLAALLLEFGRERRAHRASQSAIEEYDYLVDIMETLAASQGRDAFLLQAHLGNFSLWLSGLFPDRITARVHRKGAPGLRYYEEMGATGFRLAAHTPDAEHCGLDHLYQTFAHNFPALRIALNRIADRYLFPSHGDPVDRLLRQVRDSFQ